MQNNLTTYTISLWENELVTEDGVNYLKENKICDIGSSEKFLPCDAIDPVLTLKDNGEASFKFSFYTRYYDDYEQQEIENPYLKYLVAERRIKINRNYKHEYTDSGAIYIADPGDWYDFIISSINYDSSGKKVTIECDNAFAIELGHTGYGLEFATELENNLGSVFDLSKEVTNGSDWRILDADGTVLSYDDEECYRIPDFLKIKPNDGVYQVRVIASFDAYQTLDPTQKIQIKYDIGSTIYIKAAATCLLKGEGPFQFLYNNLYYTANVEYTKINNFYIPCLKSNGNIIVENPNALSETMNYYYSSMCSDLIQETQKEYLYRVRIKHNFTAYETLNQNSTREFKVGITNPEFIYVFSSCLTNATNPMQFVSFSLDDRQKYIEKNEVINDLTNYSIEVIYSDVSTNGIYIPTLVDGTSFIDEPTLETSLKANRYVSTALSQYDSTTDKYINKYRLENRLDDMPTTWNNGDEIRGYSEVEYLTPNVNYNLITNPNNFINTSGWSAIQILSGLSPTILNDAQTIASLKITNMASQEEQLYGGLMTTFKESGTYFFNSGFNDSRNYIDGISGSDYYVLKIQAYKKVEIEQGLYQFNLIVPSNLECSLNQYSIGVNGYYTKGQELINFASTNWKTGYNYQVLYDITPPESGNAVAYTYDETTGLYTSVIYSKEKPLSPSKTYYVVTDMYYYVVKKSSGNNLSHEDLFNSDSKYGFFIKGVYGETIYIKDFQIFSFIPKEDGALIYTDHEPFLPEELKPSVINYKYYFYKYDSSVLYKEQIQFYKTDSLISNFKQKYSENCEKRRSITSSKSNRYNILSNICENFECWMNMQINREDDGKIKLVNRSYYQQLTNKEITLINGASSGRGKYYTYNAESKTYSIFDADELHDFNITDQDKIEINSRYHAGETYYYWKRDEWGVLQEIEVVLTEDTNLEETIEYHEKRYGLDWHTNYYRKTIIKQQEKFLFFKKNIGSPNYAGFKYGVNLNKIIRKINSDKIVTKLFVEENKNEFATNGFCTIAYANSNPSGETFIYNFNHYINRQFINGEECAKDLNKLNIQLKNYNDEINSVTDELLQAQDQIADLSTNKSTYSLAYDAAVSEMTNQDNKLYQLTKQRYDYFADHEGYLADYSNDVQSTYENIKRLKSTVVTYSELAQSYSDQYDIWIGRAATITLKLTDLTTGKNNTIAAFELKYNNYIREGTWQSDDYDNAELYYLDACNTSEDSAYPKVSYTLSVTDVSGIEDFENYNFHIGDCTYIEDTELFGYCADGITPLQKDVAITQIVYNLTNPSKNTITISTFKNVFNDLFSRFEAATQKIEYNEVAYDRAASAVSNVSGITSELLQKSFENNNILISQSGNQSVVWGAETGIQLTATDAPSNVIRLIGQGVFLSNDGGLNWQAALTAANGLNASILSSGAIKTNEVSIVDGSGSTSFLWDKYGITAYAQKSLISGTLTDAGKFVRLDRFGIYAYKGGVGNKEFNSEDDIRNDEYVDFSLTWNGLSIKTHHDEYIEGIGTTRNGGININSENDFTVTDGAGTARVKIGALNVGEIGALKYGLALYDQSSKKMLVTQDDGTLWLATKLMVGGEGTFNPRASLGLSGSYTGWAKNPITDEVIPRIANSPLDPLPEFGTLQYQRIFHINDSGELKEVVKAKLLTTIDAYETLEESSYKTFTTVENQYIYIFAECLTERTQPMKFFSFDSEAEAEYILTGEIDTSEKSYSLYVHYSETSTEGYYIPYDYDTGTVQLISDISEFTTGLTGNYYKGPYKFEIFDDGTFRSPSFSVNSNGEVKLNLSTSVLYSPVFKLNSDYSLIDVGLRGDANGVGLKISSLDPQYGVEPFLRLELAVTPNSDDPELATGINPYLHMIPNYNAQNPTVDPEKQRAGQGLLKMFPNGLWLGNATQIDDVNGLNPTVNTQGIFINFIENMEGGVDHPVVKLYNGTSYTELATGNTAAVFG